MDNKHIVKAVNSVLSMWSELDDWHKGVDYQKAVDNLTKLAEELEKETA